MPAAQVQIKPSNVPLPIVQESLTYTTMQNAFGRRAIPKLIEELSPRMPKEKREHAIVQLAAEISVPGHFAQSLEEGLTTKIREILTEDSAPDSLMKLKAMEIVHKLAKSTIGRSDLVERKMLPVLINMLEDSNPGLRYNAYTALAEILNGSIVPEKQFSHADLGKENVTILQVVEAEHPLLSDSLLDKYRYETFENRPVVLNALYPFLRPTAHGAPPPDRVGTSEVRCRTITKLHTDALVALLLSIDPTDQKTAISNDLRANVCRCLAAIFAHQPLPFLHVVEHSSAKGDQGEQISIHQMALKLSILPIIMNILRVRPINRGTVNYRAPTHVLACAMQALMGLTTDVEAKKSMVRDGGIQLLIDCVGGSVKALTADRKNLTEEVIEQQSALLQHTLQTVANVSEDFRARFSLQPLLPQLQTIKNTFTDPLLVAMAKRAITVIIWRP